MGPTHARPAGVLAPLAASLLLVLYPASDSAPRASATRAEMVVGATVVARAVIAAESGPQVLEVSAADVARGYVEVRRAMRLTIANNSPYGYALDVWPAAPVFRAVEIAGFGGDVRLGDDGGAIVARGARGAALPLVLDFRFTLAPGLEPGVYPWPLRFQVRPLLGP
jgi:hypothetical protein